MPSAVALSSDFAKVTLGQETKEVVVVLLSINHDSLATPIRISSDMGEVYGYDEESGDPIYVTRHRGEDYFAAPFAYVPPGAPEDGKMPEGKLVIGNVDRRVIQAIRNVHDRLTVETKVVFASDPDTVVSSIPVMSIESVDYDAASITATLGFRHFLNEPAPVKKFIPSQFPALFKGGATS